MKVISFMAAAAAVALAATAITPSGNLRDKVARSETFAGKLDHARSIAPETARAIEHLIASVSAGGPQADPALEARRQATIRRLELHLARSTGPLDRIELSSAKP